MRHLCVSCALIAAAVVLVPSFSAAGVRIELKNGSEIFADECHESNGKFLCYKMGGTFELEKQDIASMKQTKREPAAVQEEGSPAARDSGGDVANKKDKSAVSKDPVAEGNARLDRINQRKRELQPEREKLVSEREKLKEDLKNASDWMATDRFNDLKKRISALDERIKAFNDEVTRLNQETKTITESLEKRSPQTP
jgi:chromosome segregation ATPase